MMDGDDGSRRVAGFAFLGTTGQRAEGVERIEQDGSVVFTETADAVVREVVAFDCRRFRVDEAEEVARALGAKLKDLGERFGVRLPVHYRRFFVRPLGTLTPHNPSGGRVRAGSPLPGDPLSGWGQGEEAPGWANPHPE